MSTDPGIWGWTSDIGQLGFTVTFSLGRDPLDVLTRYGADPAQVQQLSRVQAWGTYPPNFGGAQLRAGTLGRWGFCFEEAGVEGMKTRTLSRLSQDTETITFFTADDRSSFIYLKDGVGVEAFEPGRPYSLRGEEPHEFWAGTQRVLERAALSASPMSPAHATLQTIAKHIRGLLDRALLEGPLLTAFLPDADRAPINVQQTDNPYESAYPDHASAANSEPPARPARPAPPSSPTGPTGPGGHPGSLYPTYLSTGPLPLIPAARAS